MNCGGDLILQYGVLVGREEILGADLVEDDKNSLLETYCSEVRLRKKNAELAGKSFTLEKVDNFDSLGLDIVSKIFDCEECKGVYLEFYQKGRSLAVASIDK